MGIANLVRQHRDSLIEEFEGKCAYCKSSIGPVAFPQLEHFYPRNKYPDREADPDNLLIACPVCNAAKSDKFPVDSEGDPLLLNPRSDDYSEHLVCEADGLLKPLTPRGETTIEVCNLNRPALVELRKLERLQEELLDRYRGVTEDPVDVLRASIERILSLSSLDTPAQSDAIYLANLLYANVITALETYLSDRFIRLVISSRERLRAFVESFHGFKKQKFELRELFERHDTIEKTALTAMGDVIYHDLPKVKGMYEDAFQIDFPEVSNVFRSVLVRHDLVHRNGKTKTGEIRNITSDDVLKLSQEVQGFVTDVESSLAKIPAT